MDTFQERLKSIISGYKSARDFAAICEISYGVMRAYLAGKSLPGMDSLIKISRAAGIDANWLLFGEGAMRREDRGRCEASGSRSQKNNPLGKPGQGSAEQAKVLQCR